jgi:hypothetical protein
VTAALDQARELRQRLVNDLAVVDQRIAELEREELAQRRALWHPTVAELRLGTRVSFTDFDGVSYVGVVHYNHPDQAFVYVQVSDGQLQSLYKAWAPELLHLEILDAAAVTE